MHPGFAQGCARVQGDGVEEAAVDAEVAEWSPPSARAIAAKLANPASAATATIAIRNFICLTSLGFGMAYARQTLEPTEMDTPARPHRFRSTRARR
jgi:hypothetical protein